MQFQNRLLVVISTAVFGLSLSFSGWATSIENRSQLAERVFQESGLAAQVSQIPGAIQDGFDRSAHNGEFADQIPAELIPELLEGVAGSFSAETLRSNIVSVIAEKMTDTELQQVLSWHESELGQLIKNAEVNHSNVTDAGDRLDYLANLEASPLAAKRMDVLNTLEASWRIAETSVDMMINMQVAVTTALVSLMPEDDRLPVSSIVNHFRSQRPTLTEHFETETILSMAYIYKNLDESELQAYIDFAQSPVGKLYVSVTNEALHNGMLQSSLLLGEVLGQLLVEPHSMVGI